LSAPRLLLFDDDAAIVAVVKRYFIGRSWQVDTASDAAGALSVVAARPFDAVICDLHFTPERLAEGLEIVTRARAARPQAAILLFTAAGGEAVRQEALQHGADDVVNKPAPLATLHDATLRAMKKP
jgi:two-component system, OmpR family, KDP operon response regulator KdpE